MLRFVLGFNFSKSISTFQPPKKGILGPSANGRRVVIQDKVGEHVIASDNEGKNLRPVRK